MCLDRDFFISYTGADEDMALWVTRSIAEDSKYTTFMQAIDFQAGDNFIERMDKGVKLPFILLVYTSNYQKSFPCFQEWSSVLARIFQGHRQKIIPLLFENNIMPDGILAPIIGVRLFTKKTLDEKKELLMATLEKSYNNYNMI